MPIAAVEPIVASRAVTPRPSPAAAELPEAPKPVTPATAAVHIMRVPSSRLLEAFASLQRALGQQQWRERAPADAAQRLLSRAIEPAAPRPKIDIEA